MIKNLSDKIRLAAVNLHGPIPRRKLGKTGLMVTQLGLGGGCAVADNDNHEKAIEIIQAAIKLGINYFDTAAEYGGGASQINLGLGLGPDRSKIILATKTNNRTRDGSWRLLEESLKNLKTDYLDIWQIHHLDHVVEVEKVFAKDGALKALQEAKEQGVVKYIGVTGHYDPKPLLDAIKRFEFDTILMTLNAADVHIASNQKELLPEARKQDLGIVAMKIPCLGRIFHTHAIDSMEKALGYTLSLPVSTAIVGVDSIKQLIENVSIAQNFEPFSYEEMKELEKKTENYAHLALFFRKGNEKYNAFWKAYPQKPKVILTVPHGKCPPGSKERKCDLKASDFAKALEQKLEDKNYPVFLHDADTYRKSVDLNRPGSKDTDYRKMLDEELLKLGKDDILLDVHSAPPDTLEEPFDIYFLDIEKESDFIKDLSEHLSSEGYKVAILKGAKKNDIVYTAIKKHDLNKVALMEVNESFDKEYLEELAEKIVDFLIK